MAKKQTRLNAWEALAADAIDSLAKRDVAFDKFTSAVGRSSDAVGALKTTLREQASIYSQMDSQQRASFDVIRALFPQAEVDNSVEQSIKLHRLEAKLAQQAPVTAGKKREEVSPAKATA